MDAYAPGELFANGFGRGVACSNTATLSKIREDIEEAQKHFGDLKILFFATPRVVSEKKAKGWREKVKKDYGITLIVISREEVLNELLVPESASLCSSILRIPSTIEASLKQTAEDCRIALAEVNGCWGPKKVVGPLLDLSADKLGARGNQTDSILELQDIQEMLVQSRRVMLEAPAGRGKTTTAAQMAARCVAAGNLAFIVDLPSWAQTGKDILEFIAGSRPFKARSLDEIKLARLYESQHFIFLLNGWNEVAEADLNRAQTSLGVLEREYPEAGILVTTRTHRVKPPLPGTTIRARLRVLTPKQRADYVVARLGERAPNVLRRIQTEPVLDDLTLTPLFLSEVVSIAAAGKDIPNTKMGVLREVVHLPETDPTHRGTLESFPLFGHADTYLIALASSMTTKTQTQIADSDAKKVTNVMLRSLSEQGEANANTTVLQVLGALADHHVLERVEYPAVVYRFEHQQMQEYYAAESAKTELIGLVARANRDETLETIASTERAKHFQVSYVNESSWSEPLCMVAGDHTDDSFPNRSREDSVRATALLILLALDVDLIFAAELFGLCSSETQQIVSAKLSSAIRQQWASHEASHRSRALAAMVATGSDLFKDEILPLLKSPDDQSWFEVYRSSNTFRLSSLGPDWRQEVATWDEKARLTFVSEILHNAGPSREVAEFALSDPSLEVRASAVSDLIWMNTDDETTERLIKVDEPAFQAAIMRIPVRYVYPAFRGRALQAYRQILTESSELPKRLVAAGNAVLMGQFDARVSLRGCLDEIDTDRVRHMDERELRPLLEALSSDRTWCSAWIVRRVLEGALNAEQWRTFVDPVDAELKERLLQRLETEDLSKGRVPGVQGLLRLNSDAHMARRIFARILDLHTAIKDAISVRSETNLALARELGDLRRQLEGFLRKLPAQKMVDGILTALSQDFSLLELEVLAELWDWGMDNDADLHEVLTETSREAVRKYLTGAVPQLTNDTDPRGSIRAHLAVAISRVAGPDDISYVATLLESEIVRIRAAQIARVTREKSALADGSQTRYTNRYMLAVRQLQSDSEGPFLAKLLAEPECERDIPWALVEWALERSLPATVGMDGWANRSRKFEEIWEARASTEIARFDEARRKAAVGYLRAHIDSLASDLSINDPDRQIVWRLKDLMKPLATLDAKGSAALILETLALPLETHGTMDGWKRLQPLEIMLFEGATLPNAQTLAIILPVINELMSKWHSDNERSLFGMSFSIMPFLENPLAGIEVLAELLERPRMSFESIDKVVSALGHSRCDKAVDLLVSIGNKEGMFNHLGESWINAIATLDTPRAREILMSFVDPESLERTGTLKLGRDDVLSRRLAELAVRNKSIRSRILGLCKAALDRTRRDLLASVIVQLGDNESLLAGLYLLDDQRSPELPYKLGKAVEEAFVEHRPTGDSSNSYTLHPRAANQLRDRLIEMTRSDSNRKTSSLALLSAIESWRREYGRPAGETRNPIFGN